MVLAEHLVSVSLDLIVGVVTADFFLSIGHLLSLIDGILGQHVDLLS